MLHAVPNPVTQPLRRDCVVFLVNSNLPRLLFLYGGNEAMSNQIATEANPHTVCISACVTRTHPLLYFCLLYSGISAFHTDVFLKTNAVSAQRYQQLYLSSYSLHFSWSSTPPFTRFPFPLPPAPPPPSSSPPLHPSHRDGCHLPSRSPPTPSVALCLLLWLRPWPRFGRAMAL